MSLSPRVMLRASLMLVGVALACAALSACGSSSPASASASASASSTSGSGAYNAKLANSILAPVSSPPKRWPGPASSPSPAKNKKVFILAAIYASITKNRVNASAQAARALGWKPTLFNGQGNPTVYAQGLEQALNEHYDGVVMSAVDPTLVKTQVAALRRAGIPVVTNGSTVPPSPTGASASGGTNFTVGGEATAAQLARDSGGKAQILVLTDNEFSAVNTYEAGFLQTLPKVCSGCKIVKRLAVTASQIGSSALTSEVESALRANPNIGSVFAPYDDVATSVVQAVQGAGLTGKVKLYSSYGEPQNVGYVRAGQVQVADDAVPDGWIGYESIDALNRLFSDPKAPVATNVTDNAPNLMITSANISKLGIPAGQAWTGGINYVAQYRKLWGLG